MYQVGEYVVKINNGICRVEDITHLDMPSVDKNKLYYLLVPKDEEKTKLYVPVESEHTGIRKVMSSEQAWEVIKMIPEIETAWISDDKQREQRYKAALKSSEPEQLVSIIKNIYLRKKKREALGKKNTATDERYFKLAEDTLYSELAFALGKDKKEMKTLIAETIEKKQYNTSPVGNYLD